MIYVEAKDFYTLKEPSVESKIIDAMVLGKRSVMIDPVYLEYLEDLVSRGFEITKLYIEPYRLIGYKISW